MVKLVEKSVKKYAGKYVGKLCNKMCKNIIHIKNSGKMGFCTKFLVNLHNDLHIVLFSVKMEFSTFYT